MDTNKKLKLCGMFRECDIAYANEAKPDYIGFVFWEKSKRYVTPDEAFKLKQLLNSEIQAVGVVVDVTIPFLVDLCKRDIISLIQLHGKEDKAYILQLKEALMREELDIPIIKAVRVENSVDALEADKLPVDYLLLDAPSKKTVGGSGESFDWIKIPHLKHPFFLAGGIDINNVGKAMLTNAYAIDTSSGVETDGVKDKEKMLEMANAVRKQ